jgi:hypothetical protein
MVISRHFSVLYIITQSVFFDLNQLRHFQQSTRVNSTLHNALPTKHTTTMSAPRPRRGHAAVAAILSDMDRYLPSDTINRADYRRCRMVYGLMNTTYRRTDASTSPEKEYMELKILTSDLRRHLNALNASKGIPEKMSLYLDELTAAIDDGLAKGVSTEFLIAGIEDPPEGGFGCADRGQGGEGQDDAGYAVQEGQGGAQGGQGQDQGTERGE